MCTVRVSTPATQLCHCSMKAATDNKQKSMAVLKKKQLYLWMLKIHTIFTWHDYCLFWFFKTIWKYKNFPLTRRPYKTRHQARFGPLTIVCWPLLHRNKNEWTNYIQQYKLISHNSEWKIQTLNSTYWMIPFI